MYNPISEHRRKKLIREPFPPAFEEILTRNVAPYGMLDEDERAQLRALIQVFTAEKH